MGRYIFGCIALAFISAVLYHLSHTSLRESVRAAMGVVLLLFMLSPIASLISGVLDVRLPSGDFTFGESYTAVTEEAYCKGIASALRDEFSAPGDCFYVYCDGFVFETMYSKKVYVTLTGKAALLDYRAVREFVINSVETGGCEVEIEIT